MNVTFEAPLTPEANAFLSRSTGIDFSAQDTSGWFCATAYDEYGEISAVLAVEPKTWFDWYFNCAVDDPHVISRRLLRTIFKTLFSVAVRVTAEIDPTNERAISNARRMGFVYEGFKRLGVEGRRDALLFGMLRQDCRFLPGFDPARTTVRPPIGGHHGFVSLSS